MTKLKPVALAMAIPLSLNAFAQSAVVTGTIKDKANLLPGATVKVLDTGIKTTTDYKGEFEILKLPAGTYQLEVEYLSYKKQIIDIEVSENERKTLGSVVLNADNNTMEEIVVLGQILRGEMAASNIQKSSNKIINVISSDGIGKLPDRNAAEAVQRIPGVSIERDQGEGRFVAVRGLPAQWSSSTVNGSRLPTAEQETSHRGTAFDFFPSEMIEFVEVTKAITPDMEGDAIGGNVNFITRTAPAEQTFKISGAIGHHEQAGGSDNSLNLLYGDRSADDKFGYILNASYWKRNWATDNYEPRRGSDGLGVRRLELRDYTGERHTYGFNGGLEYLLEEGKIYASALYGTLKDDETHYKHRLRFDKDRIEVQHIYNEMITEMTGFELGGEHYFGYDTTLEWKAAHFDNEFRYDNSPNSEDNAYFIAQFHQSDVGFIGLENRVGSNYAYNKVDGGTDLWNKFSSHLPEGFEMDPSQAKLAEIVLYKGYINEKDNIIFSMDLTHQLTESTELKFGVKYRDKERISTFSDEHYNWDQNAGDVPLLSDFSLSDQPGRSGFLSQLNGDWHKQFTRVASINDVVSFWNRNRDNLVLNKESSALIENGGALGRHFNVFEKHTSAYGMATYTPDSEWTILGGLRLTQTDTKVEGFKFEVDVNGNESVSDTTGKKDYLSVLPSLHVKYSPSENINYRLALTRTFARPDFGFISPGSTYREADFELEAGNPKVNPTYSNNIDLMVEYYFEDAGIVSAGLFYKDISDPIFQNSSLVTYNGTEGVRKFTPANGDNASLYGLEIAYNRSFGFISSAMDNFGIQTNVTLMDSDMTIPGRKGKVSIPRQADMLYNIALYYDDANLSARIALNHKDEYIEEHGNEPTFDSYYGEYTSLDFSASYYLNDNAMVFIELNNLTDEPLYYFLGNDQRPLQLEYYGRKGMLGFNYSF
ncbi:TonB-dependent receptor [Thalassomonas viridans]|uniref:TonB-dependent receptor n=1 Tax=Thalassomonas viridans TaxID=137584 RepID=A0AAE9Z2M4_9GAMM|nr:TonB-dependent receptor [Thalassomonas viridans]WDE05651.1 TonB-dependent receptor [Thalassomonas viridans]